MGPIKEAWPKAGGLVHDHCSVHHRSGDVRVDRYPGAATVNQTDVALVTQAEHHTNLGEPWFERSNPTDAGRYTSQWRYFWRAA